MKPIHNLAPSGQPSLFKVGFHIVQADLLLKLQVCATMTVSLFLVQDI